MRLQSSYIGKIYDVPHCTEELHTMQTSGPHASMMQELGNLIAAGAEVAALRASWEMVWVPCTATSKSLASDKAFKLHCITLTHVNVNNIYKKINGLGGRSLHVSCGNISYIGL